MKRTITKSYTFAASHQLLPQEVFGKCSQLHGHTYKIDVTIGCQRLINSMVINFSDLDKIVEPIIETLDHSHLNNTVSTPTAERICEYIYNNIVYDMAQINTSLIVEEVSVWESLNTKTSLKNSL